MNYQYALEPVSKHKIKLGMQGCRANTLEAMHIKAECQDCYYAVVNTLLKSLANMV